MYTSAAHLDSASCTLIVLASNSVCIIVWSAYFKLLFFLLPNTAKISLCFAISENS